MLLPQVAGGTRVLLEEGRRDGRIAIRKLRGRRDGPRKTVTRRESRLLLEEGGRKDARKLEEGRRDGVLIRKLRGRRDGMEEQVRRRESRLLLEEGRRDSVRKLAEKGGRKDARKLRGRAGVVTAPPP